MLNIKTIEQNSEKIARRIETIGLVTMSLAAVASMAELTDYVANRLVLARAEVAYVTQAANINSPMLRERDDTGPHYATYSINRTATRSGKQ